MKSQAALMAIGLVTAVEKDSLNYSYMKKKTLGVKDDFSILSTVSNWFSGSSDSAMEHEARKLQ